MPELPEVETVKRVIEPQITGLVIKNVIINNAAAIEHPSADAFRERLTGQRFSRMERRGKFLIFQTESGDRVILHLRMTGCLLFAPQTLEPQPHTHVVFELNGGSELRFSDTRRFGRFWLIANGEEDTYSGMEKLGAEPFSEAFGAEYLRAKCGKSRRAIKECLLDQRVVAGIGNIYADEILFACGINPAAPAAGLESGEWERLAELIPERLNYFTEKNAITPEDYLRGKGRDYRNTPNLQVYGRADAPCPRCGETLRKTVIGGRSSVYCPQCQGEGRPPNAAEIYDILLSAYGEPRWWSDDPYTVMFQAVLVQNTAWSNVEKTCAALGERLTAAYIAGVSAEELEQLIRSCGFFKAKAAAIKTLTAWFAQYGYQIGKAGEKDAAALRAELLALKGIGAETADVILVYALHKPVFVIDAYTRRFLRRLGHAFADDVGIKAFFENGIEADYHLYGYYHWFILDHGKAHCRKTPLCTGCPFENACAYAKAPQTRPAQSAVNLIPIQNKKEKGV